MILGGMKRRRVSIARSLAAGTLAFGLTACGSSGTTDERQVVESLLGVLTAGDTAICVDGRTRGEPLAVYRSMLPAPDPARRPLYWVPPAPLQTGRVLSNRELVDTEFRDGQALLPEHAQSKDRLPYTVQRQLDGVAREASVIQPDGVMTLSPNARVPLARVRWWVRNRFDKGCDPVYTLSHPIIVRNQAFVTVTAGHHGSTYAFRKTGPGWAPVAKWSTWLY